MGASWNQSVLDSLPISQHVDVHGLSIWLVALTGALLFWGGFYLQRYSGNFQSLVYDETASGLPVPAAAPAPGGGGDLAKGKQLYNNIAHLLL